MNPLCPSCLICVNWGDGCGKGIKDVWDRCFLFERCEAENQKSLFEEDE